MVSPKRKAEFAAAHTQCTGYCIIAEHKLSDLYDI